MHGHLSVLWGAAGMLCSATLYGPPHQLTAWICTANMLCHHLKAFGSSESVRRARNRVVLERGGSRAEEGDRGAGGRWDETSHTSRKGNGVKVEGDA
ncbi:hypothetical protein NQZ68_003762 [Dissostichus eleginoides]|nr:hypothetical protein NQZ68_003762 [Dissostichus eleginoides]